MREFQFILRRTARFGLLLAPMFFLTGCIAFRGDELKSVDSFPQVEGPKKSARLNLTYRLRLNEENVNDLDGVTERNLQDRATEIFTNSGLFSNVATDVPNPDLNIKIDMLDEGQHHPHLKLVTAMTAYLIPNKAVDNYVMNASVLDSNGKEIGHYQIESSVTQWQQLFLIFATPFKGTGRTAWQANEDMFGNLVQRIHEDGLTAAAPAGSPAEPAPTPAPAPETAPEPTPEPPPQP